MSFLADLVGNVAGDIEYYFGGGQEEETRGKALDEQINSAQQDELDRGRWTQEQFDQAQVNLHTGQTGDVQAQLQDAGREGANQSAVGRSIDKAGGFSFDLFSGVLKGIPWWVYVVGIGAVFLYLGGGSIIRSQVARRLA